MKEYDLIIVGGGIAGMTAALSAAKENIDKILIIEREEILGGALNQCIFNGFGEEILDRKVTGPEYIYYLEERIKNSSVEIKLNASVLEVLEDKVVRYVSPDEGVVDVKGKAVILASGCREKYTGNIDISTNSLVGIYTIGNAHRIITLEGYMPGKRPVIVVSSRWGLVVARRIVIEGGKIQGLLIDKWEDFEFNEEDKELIRDFDIPVIENHKIIKIYGNERIEGVIVKNLNNNQENKIKCDSLIMSVGYFPEKDMVENLNLDINDYTKSIEVKDYQTNIQGLFACGNFIYGIHALKESGVNGIDAGIAASKYIKNL